MSRCLLVFAFVLFAFAASSYADTPVSKDMADKYLANCLKRTDPRLTPASQQSMCSCTAEQLQKSMTVEDMQMMARNDESGRLALNKMLLDVYAPCMSDPVKDLLVGECAKNPQVSASQATSVCSCVAKLTGDWYATVGRDLMAQALKDNPNVTDPISPIMDSAEFKSVEMKYVQSCMQEH